MSNVTVSVLDVDINVSLTSKAGKPYTATIFRYDDGQDRKKQLASFTLDNNPVMRDVLHSLKKGDLVNLEMEKNDAGYLDIMSITKASGNEKVGTRTGTTTAKTGGGAFNADARQDSIVFQNAMMHAVNITIHNTGKGKIKVKEIIAMAKKIARVSRNPKLDELTAEEAIPAATPVAVVEPVAPPVVAKVETTTTVADEDVDFGD